VNFIDHIFFVAAYAALTLCEYDITNPIIDQVQIQLIHISPNEEHIAYRFACVVGELKRRSTEVVHHHASPSQAVHTRRLVNAGRGHAAPVPPSSAVPEGYASLEQLLTGFMPAPADSIPTPVYGALPALPPTSGMVTLGIAQHHRHFQSPLPE
jgi:hypothetical protein